MSMLSKVEKVEREIFKQGYFTVKNTILTGKKGKDNIKLDAVYNKTYASQKYSNKSELTSTTISTSEFIVFAYNHYEAKANEEIYASYPNLLDVKHFCQQILAMVTSKEVFNSNNSVNMNYQDYSIASQPLGGGKVLVAIPASLQKDQNLVKGIYLFFNGEDKYIEMDAKAVFTLNEVVKSIDLMLLSNTTLMLGMLANLNSIGDEETFTSAPKSPLPPRGNLFGNKGGSRFKTRVEGNNQSANSAPVEENSDPFACFPDMDGQQQEEKAPVSNGPKFKAPNGKNDGLKPRATNPSPVTSGEDVMNFNNIMNEANNIEFEEPTSDEEIQF